ncbi:hypothetical protein V9T40_007812 [Parthenolecanium corni]|uniref:Uncharacterized protein n=1 Tax=Parthenolecanium corni TaxID=536013 RepID=A0AAN9TW00_9HEMI
MCTGPVGYPPEKRSCTFDINEAPKCGNHFAHFQFSC